MPANRSRQQRGNHGSRRSNPTIPLTHLAGHVMWLPPEDEITVDTNLQDGCYNHPVLILSPQPSGGEVTILMMTSLGGMNLLQKYPGDRNMALRRKHLPVYPSNPHPDLDILLSLEGDRTLTKSSYIRTGRQHSIEFAALRPYRGPRTVTKYVLTTESYQQVIKHAGFHAPIPSPEQTSIHLHNDALLVLDTSRHTQQGIDFSRVLPQGTAAQRLNLHDAALRYETIAPAQPETSSLHDAYMSGRRDRESTRSSTLLPLHNNTQPRAANRYVPQHSSRGRGRGRNASSGPSGAQIMLSLAFVLALVTGAGFGMYSAWVYRAALGRALVDGILWVGKNVFGLVKFVGKWAWRVVAWLLKHGYEMAKGVCVKGWELLKGVFSG